MVTVLATAAVCDSLDVNGDGICDRSSPPANDFTIHSGEVADREARYYSTIKCAGCSRFWCTEKVCHSMARDFETSLICSDVICVEQMVGEDWLLEFEVALNASREFKPQLVLCICCII